MLRDFLKNIIVIVGVTICFAGQAQQNDSTVTIIFTGNHSNSKPKEEKVKKIPKFNILKLAPTGIFIGAIPIIYERKIIDNLSIQASVGLTNRNFIRGIFKRNTNALNITFPWPANVTGSDMTDDIYKFDVRQPQTGTMYTIQPKFYFNEEAPEGFYLGFSLDHYNYKFSTPKCIPNASGYYVQKGELQNESESINDYMLHLGYQSISNNHIVFEASMAAGIRRVEGNKYVATIDYNNNFYDGIATYREQGLLNLEFALRVGYAF